MLLMTLLQAVMLMLLMTLLHFCCICLTGLLLKATFLIHKKQALVFPTLKKPNLDPDLSQNYHPISNLSFLSKQLVSLQLLPYLEQSGLLPLKSVRL